MSVESDTLDVLRKLNTQLENSSRMTGRLGGGSTQGGASTRYDAQAARAEEASQIQTRKIVVSTGKAVDRLGFVSNNASERLIDFTRRTGAAGIGLGDLTTVVGKSIAQISAQRAELGKIDMSTTLTSLQAAVQDAASSIKASNLAKGDTTGFARTIGTLDDLIDNKVNPRLGTFNSALHLASTSLIDLWGDMREQRRDGGKEIAEFGKGVAIAANALSRNRGVGEYFEKFILQLRRANVALCELRSGARSGGSFGGGDGGGGGGNRRDNTAADSSKNKSFSAKIFSAFFDPVKAAGVLAGGKIVTTFVKIIDQAFQTTAARGFGVFGENFKTLSFNAILAGQSLEEYTKMLDANEGTVSRFASFKAFDNQLDIGREQLKKFGIFGQEATNLSAAMVNSAQTLGVPVTDLSKSMTGQMSVFDQLRKTTGITAEEFEKLNRNLQENETVQRELIGLDPAERAARLTQLQQTSTWGKSLGLTSQASNQLTDALLAQRKTTVKDRFNARGRLTQSLALVGTDPATIAEAATLAGKRMKTPEEEKRLTEILGEYNKRAEEIKQNGGEGMANAVETSQEQLNGTTLKPLLDASIAVKGAQDSGTQVNKDMDKKLGSTEQKIGTLISLFEGLAKSPIVQFGVGAIALAITALQVSNSIQLTTLPQRIAAAIKLGGGLGGGGGGGGGTYGGNPDDFVGPQKPGGKGKGGIFRRMAGSAKGIAKGAGLGSVIGGVFAAIDYSNAEENAKVENGGDGDIGKKKGEAIGEGIGSVAGGIIGAALGSIVPVIGTAIGGVLGSFLGGWFGKLTGGWVGGENASEKNTKEVNKLSKEMIATRRQTAASDVIATDNMASLASNVLQTGKAYADNTAAQNQKIQDDVNKSNGTTQTAQETETYDITDPMTGVVIGQGIRNKNGGATSTKASTPSSSIATPASTTPTSVNQEAVNTAATAATAAAVASTTTVASRAGIPASADSASTLADILKILQQSLIAENTQIELANQLLRNTVGSRLPDNLTLMGQARYTA